MPCDVGAMSDCLISGGGHQRMISGCANRGTTGFREERTLYLNRYRRSRDRFEVEHFPISFPGLSGPMPTGKGGRGSGDSLDFQLCKRFPRVDSTEKMSSRRVPFTPQLEFPRGEDVGELCTDLRRVSDDRIRRKKRAYAVREGGEDVLWSDDHPACTV